MKAGNQTNIGRHTDSRIGRQTKYKQRIVQIGKSLPPVSMVLLDSERSIPGLPADACQTTAGPGAPR